MRKLTRAQQIKLHIKAGGEIEVAYEVQTWTGQYGWECVDTEPLQKDAISSANLYRKEMPGRYRVVKVTEMIPMESEEV